MTARASRIARLLEGERAIDEHGVREHRISRVERELGPTPAVREVDARELVATVFVDAAGSRGSSSFALEEETPGEVSARAARAAALAGAGRGPSWRLPPPSAPARVEVADPDLEEAPARAIEAAAFAVSRALPRALRVAAGVLAVERRTTAVVTSRGFADRYRETRIEVDLLVAPSRGRAAPVRVARRARRLADLALEDALEDAQRRARDLAAARPLESGVYDLLLRGEALSPPWSRFGWLAPLVEQARSERVRLGLTLYQPGQSIYGARAVTGDRLSLTSDGALPYRLLSRPFGDLGEPTRRFDLVRDGDAAELALDAREAALRARTPNGGARTLVVAAGTASLDSLSIPGDRPLLEVTELSDLEVDPATGGFTAALGLGILRTAGRPGAPVYGGAVAGNVFDLLARARLSAEVMDLGAYRGPVGILTERVVALA